MAGYREVVSPGRLQDDDIIITPDDDNLWLLTNLKDERLDGGKILKEPQEQNYNVLVWDPSQTG